MFRSKKKKTQGRKRREVGAETAAQDVGASSLPVAAAESELQRLEELRRSRSRATTSSLTFSSKSSSHRTHDHTATFTAAQTETETGLLSFDDERGERTRRTKMRPNLVASSAVDVEMEEDTGGQYSAEKMASLRSEQSVLLSRKSGEVETTAVKMEDVEMEEVLEVEEGNDEEAGRVLQREEEFISLDSQMKTRRSKSRVTFGVHTEIHNLSKDAEVEEEMSGDEDGDNEQSRRWEEELMRRGGHRVAPASESNGGRSGKGLSTYPTRKKVSCVTLDSVLMKLEKSLEATSFEDERASRELARLEAETALIETTLKQQREELLTSSEEFEYFQEVEDFVKGLSFCLREKVPVIKAKEKNILGERIQHVESRRQEELRGAAEDIRICLGLERLQEADIVGQLDIHSDGDAAAVVPPRTDAQRAARLHKYQQHFTESYAPKPSHVATDDEDMFAEAIDEISTLDRVYGRFQEWKAKFPDVYNNVYCELAQEKLYAPYVQAELLNWDPLSVADEGSDKAKAWSLDEFSWFRVLNQHLRQLGDSGNSATIDGPIIYQIRDVLLEKACVAVSSYFDPYSSLQARSLSLLLEELTRHGYTPHVVDTLQILVSKALNAFSSEAKRTVLIAVDQTTAETCEDMNMLARYLLERFNALQDNLLNLFVALPKGDIAAAGFRCLLQVFHQLLAYVRRCQEAQKLHFIPTATQIVRQLSGSSYLLQLLTEPSQEHELKHMMELFAPFLQKTH